MKNLAHFRLSTQHMNSHQIARTDQILRYLLVTLILWMFQQFSKTVYVLFHLSSASFDWIDWMTPGRPTDWMPSILTVVSLASNPRLLEDSLGLTLLKLTSLHCQRSWQKNTTFRFLSSGFYKVSEKGIHRCRYWDSLPFLQLQNIF